jgi:hypothetical protein
MRRRTLAIGSLAVIGSIVACSSSDDGGGDESVPEACRSIAVDRFKELLIVDEAVTRDPRALNASNGAWSFRHAIESLSPPGVAPEALIRQWIDTYTTSHRINLFNVASRPLVTKVLLCPWLRRTPANECNEDCSACKEEHLDLAVAPFRLIGIANRIDLRETVVDASGEGRLVFGMMDGPGDDPASVDIRGTVILEYALPTVHGETMKTWADRWHALGTHQAFDESFRSDLQAITDTFVSRGSWPGHAGDSALQQLRTNERAFDWQWDLREYKLAPNGIVLAPTQNAPDATVSASASLASWVEANRATVLQGKHVLPADFTGGASQPLTPVRPDGLDEQLRSAFAKETCAGCHQLERTPVDINFHVSPAKKGIEKLSPFLNNPADPANDELGRRTLSLRRALCGK